MVGWRKEGRKGKKEREGDGRDSSIQVVDYHVSHLMGLVAVVVAPCDEVEEHWVVNNLP